jgi:hypothetical protein
LLLPALLLLAAAGCGRSLTTPADPAAGPALKPVEYQMLKDREKIRYKNVVVRVPESWGGALLPFDPGPYRSPIEKAVHGGDLNTLMGLYNQSLFELQHPRVRIEYINFDMWSDNFRSALAVALASNRAPAYYIARDLPQTIEQGMYAELTPLMKKWDQFDRQPEGSIREGTVDGRIYTLAANELGATILRYRKDWFREAGIFNERGEPGPRSDWTWDDFRRIAKQLTDPKRGRFGYAGQMDDLFYNQAYGIELYVPDPTGRRTWVFNDRDPDVLRSLQQVRAMVNEDKSVLTSVSMGWSQWHNEFDASHAAMIWSFAPHVPRESLSSPEKFGRDKPYAETVGMAVPPHGPGGMSGLRPITNPIGFDPTLSPGAARGGLRLVQVLLLRRPVRQPDAERPAGGPAQGTAEHALRRAARAPLPAHGKPARPAAGVGVPARLPGGVPRDPGEPRAPAAARVRAARAADQRVRAGGARHVLRGDHQATST